VHDARAILVPPDAWSREVEDLVRKADRVLIDAPCSGLGSLRRHPDLRWRIEAGDVARLREQQLALLARAAPLLRPGARLVYATCTLLRQENESVVEATRTRFPHLEPVRIVEILGKERGQAVSDPSGTWLRMLPHRHGSDGFFAAVLRSRG
jgi:16S rRNA (cytosine967-C5)-methyltransferase